jgi:hypothetical protein
MRVVADRLADWAASEADADNADLFGRSAFNRYYYAAYLITREMLRKLDPKWAASGHRQIPDLLQKTVTKKARQSIKNAEKNRLIDPGMASWLRQSLSNIKD